MAVVGNEPSAASAHIKDYELMDYNFELAWQALKNRYENKRILINNQVKKIYGIQAPQSETLKFLRIL
ncbi:hypothetical protein CVS40_5795 [Lucilia cuprina]|nr:hypothetical protein CVS40_5795 [Lucilia cuprina]